MMTDSLDTTKHAFFGPGALEQLTGLIPLARPVQVFSETGSIAARPVLVLLRNLLARHTVADLAGTPGVPGAAVLAAGCGVLPAAVGWIDAAGAAAVPDADVPADHDGQDRRLYLCLDRPLACRDHASWGRYLAAIAGDSRVLAVQRPQVLATGILAMLEDCLLFLAADPAGQGELRQTVAANFLYLVRESHALTGAGTGPAGEARTILVARSWHQAAALAPCRHGLFGFKEQLVRNLSKRTSLPPAWLGLMVLPAILHAWEPAGLDRLEPLMSTAWNLQWGDSRVRFDEGMGRLLLWARGLDAGRPAADSGMSEEQWRQAVRETCADQTPEQVPAGLDRDTLARELAGRW